MEADIETEKKEKKIINGNRYLNTEADAYWLMQTSSHGPHYIF